MRESYKLLISINALFLRCSLSRYRPLLRYIIIFMVIYDIDGLQSKCIVWNTEKISRHLFFQDTQYDDIEILSVNTLSVSCGI